MTDIICSCGEKMDEYDTQMFTNRKEIYFICEKCKNKKKQVIVYNEQGAELFVDLMDDN